MCYSVAHDKKLPSYQDDEISIGYRLLPKNMATEALEAFGPNVNFIDTWLKLLEENYEARCVAYITSMKKMIKQIPLTMIKELTPKQKVQKLMMTILNL